MKLIGISPGRGFSGFETSFFEAVQKQGTQIQRIAVELPFYRAFCLISSFHPDRNIWGPRYSHLYHTAISAFRRKTAFVQRQIRNIPGKIDGVYQIGSMWNPLPKDSVLPLFLQVDFTSKLSMKRVGGWPINSGREADFWIGQEVRLYKQAAIIFTTTENARRSIIDDYNIPDNKVITVGGGVSAPFDNLEPERRPAYGSKKILFIGKDHERKGLDTLLEAFETVRKSIPDAHLTIIGPAGLTLNIPGVDNLGRISDKNIIRDLCYQHAVFAMPSRFEPFGQVFVEAMACQLPCIGTTVDAMPEIIEHGVTGYTIQPDDSKAMAEYIAELLTDREKAMAMGSAGFKRLQTNFTWEIVGKKIVDNIKISLSEKEERLVPVAR